MRIPIDRGRPYPLYRQVQSFLREAILTGALPAQMRLPASRELAAALGVSRITITNAYAELEAEGLTFTRPGSGTYVGPPLWRPPLWGEVAADVSSLWPAWQKSAPMASALPSQTSLDQVAGSVSRSNIISFADGLGAFELFPREELRKAFQAAMHGQESSVWGYGDRSGFPPLRTTIARILSRQGIPTNPDSVLITSGSQQALALVARLLLQPGQAVAVESPTYVGALALFRSLGVDLVGIPMDEEGMQVDKLEEALRARHVGLIYTIPSFHNPSGVSMSDARRRALVDLAGRLNVPVVEDDYVGDLCYEGPARPALKALDRGGWVIYLGTFSKILMPGLRVGYLVATGPIFEKLLSWKWVNDLTTCTIVQRALHGYINVGRYQAHLRRIVREYRRRRDAMLAAVSDELRPWAEWRKPEGGLFLWIALRADTRADRLYAISQEEGVTYVPGELFFPDPPSAVYLRLNFATHAPEIIQAGISRLAKAVGRCDASAGPRKSLHGNGRGQDGPGAGEAGGAARGTCLNGEAEPGAGDCVSHVLPEAWGMVRETCEPVI